MDIAPTLVTELARQGISFDIIPHSYSLFSLNTANTAHVPVDKTVKSVILEDEKGFVMALVPANKRVKIRELNLVLHRTMGLATEEKLQSLFPDCEPGAIPPAGSAYNIDTVVDYALDDCSDVYIEAGNHRDLLHINAKSFRKLTHQSKHGHISYH